MIAKERNKHRMVTTEECRWDSTKQSTEYMTRRILYWKDLGFHTVWRSLPRHLKLCSNQKLGRMAHKTMRTTWKLSQIQRIYKIAVVETKWRFRHRDSSLELSRDQCFQHYRNKEGTYCHKKCPHICRKFEIQQKDKFFIRAYRTQEDAGDSYDAVFTALRLQEYNQTSNQDWYTAYKNNWRDQFEWEDVNWEAAEYSFLNQQLM